MNPVVVRRAGPDRIATAVELSRSTFAAGTDTVLVAAGGAFPDGLAASAAAGRLLGPVLLLADGDVPEAVEQEILRLQPRRVVIVGGEAAVPASAEARLRDLAEEVVRAAGDDRYGTAAALSRLVFPDGTPEVWVASGEGFADALAAGPAAGRGAGPLLLTAGGALPEVTREEIGRLGPDRIVVPGGPAAVGEAVLDDLRALAPVERVAGDDRFATAAAISGRAFPTAGAVVVASGRTFPDALAAGAVAALAAGPVLPVEPDAIPSAVEAELRRLRPERITIAGGPAAVSDAVQRQLEALDIRA